MRWQPGASATLRYRVGRGSSAVGLYGKVLAGTSVEVVDAIHQQLSVGTHAPWVAEPLGADVALRVLWTREVPGGPLLDRLRAHSPALVEQAAASVAGTLAALHASATLPARTTSRDAHVIEARRRRPS